MNKTEATELIENRDKVLEKMWNQEVFQKRWREAEFPIQKFYNLIDDLVEAASLLSYERGREDQRKEDEREHEKAWKKGIALSKKFKNS